MSRFSPLRSVACIFVSVFGLHLSGCLPQGMDLSSPQGVMASGNRVTSRSLLPAGKRKRFEITCDYPGSCKSKAKESCSGPYDVEEDSTEDAAYHQTDESADADTQAQQNTEAIEEAHAHDGTSAPKHRLVVKCK